MKYFVSLGYLYIDVWNMQQRLAGLDPGQPLFSNHGQNAAKVLWL